MIFLIYKVFIKHLRLLPKKDQSNLYKQFVFARLVHRYPHDHLWFKRIIETANNYKDTSKHYYRETCKQKL